MSTNGDAPPHRAQIIITLLANGQISWSAPVHDRMACYALLEVARDEIQKAHAALEQSSIVRASPGDIPHLALKS